MIVWENQRNEDISLKAPIRKFIERAIVCVGAGEHVEATPKNLRSRKKILNKTNAAAPGKTAPSVPWCSL